jgi:dipeptidase E
VARLLLISNSTSPGEGYLDHCEAEIISMAHHLDTVAFVPYALHDVDRYAGLAEERFSKMGLRAVSIHRSANPKSAVAGAPAFFVGGGNTFRLLDRLARGGLLEPIRSAVAEGAVYMGASAGANLACPTIATTNDMPIVEPPTFRALGLVPFQINPHYVDRDPDVAHGGETREQRIAEYHEEQQSTVIGLREGSMLRVDDERVVLAGTRPARIFEHGHPPREVAPGSRLDELLEAPG